MANTAIHRVIDLVEGLLARPPAGDPGIPDPAPADPAATPRRANELLVFLAAIMLLPVGVAAEWLIDAVVGTGDIRPFTTIAVLLVRALIVMELAFTGTALFLWVRGFGGGAAVRRRRLFLAILGAQSLACLLCCVVYLDDGFSRTILAEMVGADRVEPVGNGLVALFGGMLILGGATWWKLWRAGR